MSNYVITCDVGTTGIKTCLYDIGDTFRLIAAEMAGYHLYIGQNGSAEQDPAELWQAMCITTKKVMEESGVPAGEIRGLSFCSQMQGLILVDRDGVPVRRSMSYMDQRATREIEEGLARGITVAGMNVRKLVRSLRITGAVAGSVKDPVWKYNWVKHNEPEVFARVHKWLDVKEYLILQCTGEFVMTLDSAFGTMLYDIRPGRHCFSKQMCAMFGINMDHLPRILRGTDQVGPLTANAAAVLGLAAGTLVFGGGGDASLIGIGAGASAVGSTHVYSGTSGWVSTVVQKRKADLSSMIASIVGANEHTYNYFAELETAGKCLEWVKDHLALDEINIYLKKQPVTESLETIYESLYDFMLQETKDIPAGSHGVIFTPWLHGNRCPFEDPNAHGMFFNISLETGKRDLIHAVVEGICYHLRWQLEAQQKKVRTSRIIRFVGGGALAPVTCQTLANILGREVQTVHNPQNVGALGAAVVVTVGLGLLGSVEEADRLIRPCEIYYPDPTVRPVHDRNFKLFKALYYKNKKAFRVLGTPL